MLFEQFLSRKFGEGWSEDESHFQAYVCLEERLDAYISYVRCAPPGHDESERRRGAMADSPPDGGSGPSEPSRPTSGRNRLYDILVVGEIAIHSSVVGGTSTPPPDVRRRGVEHVHRVCCENRRFGSSTSAACAAPSTAAV